MKGNTEQKIIRRMVCRDKPIFKVFWCLMVAFFFLTSLALLLVGLDYYWLRGEGLVLLIEFVTMSIGTMAMSVFCVFMAKNMKLYSVSGYMQVHNEIPSNTSKIVNDIWSNRNEDVKYDFVCDEKDAYAYMLVIEKKQRRCKKKKGI